MTNIPHKALKLGAETINEFPVRYNKTRLSGRNLTPYFLHCRSAMMPGQINKFRQTPTSKPDYNEAIYQNSTIEAYKQKNEQDSNHPLGPKYNDTHLESYTFNQFSPIDDESLQAAINASYRQVFGNLIPMQSERPIEIERRLRNGDISIKEFIRNICKSAYYKFHYFESISQERSIKLRFKHLLGRAPKNNNEIIKSVVLINEKGFYNHIDYLINSTEYNRSFGDDIVPYLRGWNSEIGLNTRSFLSISSMSRGLASSDSLDRNKKNIN